MKVFVCTDFVGQWPVGASAVIVATDAEEASLRLQAKLEEIGLTQDASFTLVEISTRIADVHILQTGEY
jgi:Fe2+ transport system protein FeoA